MTCKGGDRGMASKGRERGTACKGNGMQGGRHTG